MKNNLIKIIKKSLLLTTVLFISCSKDNYEDLGKENNNSKYKLTVLNSKELKKQGKLVKKLENFRAFTKLQNDNNKTATSSIYNFSIETRNVKLIETESIKTYTFKVNRTIDNGLFENLLITELSNGSYTAKLLQYNLSESEKTALFSGSDIDVNGKLNVINIDDPNLITDVIGKFEGDCYDTIFVYQEPHNCQGPDTHAPGNIDCPYWFTDQSMAASYGGYVSFIVSVDCDGGGGGDGLGVITTPVGGGGTGNISAQDLFFAGITEQQQEWIDSQSESVFASILNYFNQNGYSEANRNKIYQLMNVAIQNNSTFVINNSNPSTNPLNFNNVSEFQNYLNNNISNVQNVGFEDLVQNERLAKCDFSYGTFGISVKIKQKMLPTYQVLNVTTIKTGLSILLSWIQNEYVVNINGSLVEIDIYGIASTGVNIGGGLNLTYEDQVHYHIVIDKNTGQIITANEIND